MTIKKAILLSSTLLFAFSPIRAIERPATLEELFLHPAEQHKPL